MLTTLKEVLAFAEEKKAAIPAFNIDNMEIVQSIIKASEEENYPVILAVGQAAIKDGKLALLAATAQVLAKKSPIPVVLHLDHGQNLEQVRMALDCDFTSVMIDGSKLPFHENVEISKRALEMARSAGATVEAELGCILGVEDDISHDDSKPFLVRTEDVEAFNKAVTVDALAVGIGNAHGIYKGLPNLDFDRLSEVNRYIFCSACSPRRLRHPGRYDSKGYFSRHPQDQRGNRNSSGLCQRSHKGSGKR